jgi:dTDP-4-amino-4,6-dideoxygalactose transaminase
VTRLALLGGAPAFDGGVAFFRPATPPLERVVRRLQTSYDQGVLTNGPLVRELERATAERLQVEHVIAVSSCTAGLMLALRALGPVRSVLLPSFTFSASAHAVAWNGSRPIFAECDPGSFQLDVADASARIADAGAVLATHVFGAPCPAEHVEAIAARNGLPVVFDAAHAFGAARGERVIGGFGDVEVFSLSPTKPVTAGEGGLVATNSPELAASVRLGRNYGDPGNYDTQLVGLNARMSELHAALALESLAELDVHLEARRRLAGRYRELLSALPGLRVQEVGDGDSSTWKDFTISVDEREFGVGRDTFVAALRAEGVETRCYFDPPVHRQRAYAGEHVASLPVTEQTARNVVSLPLYPTLGADLADEIVELTARIQASAEEIRATGVDARSESGRQSRRAP